MSDYDKHIEDLCVRIVEKWDAGEPINPDDINGRLEAGNPANHFVHVLCAQLKVPGFYKPRHTPACRSAEDSRSAMAGEMGRFIDRALEWNKRDVGDAGADGLHMAFQVDPGLGKSWHARNGVARFTFEARAARISCRVLWLVPYHRLSDEALNEFNRLGVSAAVWRGREAVDPETGQSMCLALEAVREAQAVHADVETTVCGSADGHQCPFRGTCRYQRQKESVDAADVIIAANNVLFTPIPTDDVGLVVIDEGFWQRGSVQPYDISLGSLADDVLRYPVLEKSTVDQSGTDKLVKWCQYLERVATSTADSGFITASMLRYLSAADAQMAAKLEWARKVDAGGLLWPGMNSADRKRAVGKAAVNKTLARRAEMWRAIEAIVSHKEDGRLLKMTDRKASGGCPKLVVYSRRNVNANIARLPILHLDATLALDQVKVFLPHMQEAARLNAETPHQHIMQVLSTISKEGLPAGGFGKTSMVPDGSGSAEDKRRRRRNRNIRDFIELQVADGTGLVITYKDAEAEFAGIRGVDVAHFNAIAGLDTFGSVDCLFVIGRPLGTADSHHAISVALSGKHPTSTDMVKVVDHILMRDGGGAPIVRMGFKDDSLESIRCSITDAEVIQAVGRARGVNRTANNPVRIFVFNDVALPFAVDRLTTWGEVNPNVVEKMWTRGAVLLSPSDAHRVYPDLFGSEEAAKKALQRARKARGHTPIRSYYMDLSPSAVRIIYQARGGGQKKRAAWCSSTHAEWLRERLQQVHGPLARFDVDEMPAQPEDGPPSEPAMTGAVADLSEAITAQNDVALEQVAQDDPSWETVSDWTDRVPCYRTDCSLADC